MLTIQCAQAALNFLEKHWQLLLRLKLGTPQFGDGAEADMEVQTGMICTK